MYIGRVSGYSRQFGNSRHIYCTRICTKFTTGTVLFLEHSKCESSNSKQSTNIILTSNDSS